MALKTTLSLAIALLASATVFPFNAMAWTPADDVQIAAIARSSEGDLLPQTGEIKLEGTLELDGENWVLRADAYALPGGKRANIATPKAKALQLDKAAIWTRGDPFWRLNPADLKAGYRAIIVGKDNGSGQSLPARALSVVRVESGKPLDYFVSKAGSPANDGSAERPWAFIEDASSIMGQGSVQTPVVLHLGAGQFAPDAYNSLGEKITQLCLENLSFLTITGAGAREGGTQITSGDGAKSDYGVLGIFDSTGIRICNMTIGDDRAWTNKDAFFEGTVVLGGKTEVSLEAVHLLGPSRQTTIEADSRRAPTAIRVRDASSETRLSNVLVTGHGSFLSNPQGRVSCRNVTFAQIFGVGLDDNFLFLQTPKGGTLNEPRYSFADCIFYELARQNFGNRVLLSSGEEAEDKATWLPPIAPDGGNFVVRARYEVDGIYLQKSQMPSLFGGKRDKRFTLAHGVWENDDTQAEPTGALEIWNELQLQDNAGFAFISPIDSGWHGGFASSR